MEMEDANARTHKGRWQKNESSTSKWARQYLNQGRGRGRGRGKKEDGGDGDENQLYRGNKSKQTKRGRDRGAEQRQMQTKKHQEDLLESSPVLPSSWSVQSGPAACEPDNQYSWNTIPVP